MRATHCCIDRSFGYFGLLAFPSMIMIQSFSVEIHDLAVPVHAFRQHSPNQRDSFGFMDGLFEAFFLA